ncbi:MAG: hypothetical protein HZA51_14725 [Planctomycetes bacterium]|nr:hypothetical protein [Planctomycetota bacterium]
MTHTRLQGFWRLIGAIAIVFVSGCVCMGGGELLDRVGRSRSDEHEMGGGMCGGGMMSHGATNGHASSQPTHPNTEEIKDAKNSHDLR